jgi:hypothetical protein
MGTSSWRSWASTSLVVVCAVLHCGGEESDACPSGEKKCDLKGAPRCVPINRPEYGCEAPVCSPCPPPPPYCPTDACDPIRRGCYIIGCEEGYRHCAHDCNLGCETSINSDVEHCGQCDHPCASPVANGRPACQSGRCVAECSAGFGDCDKMYANGCETDLQTNAEHCGQCASPCPSGATCIAGRCM